MASESSRFAAMYLNEWSIDHAKLVQLATSACAEYDRRCGLSEDPSAPSRSMQGFPTFTQIRRETIDTRYSQASQLGFEGDVHAWAQYVYGRREETDSQERILA